MQVYIHREGQQFGPYSIKEANDYMASGNLQADDLAWHEGAPDWMPLKRVMVVAPTAPTPPRPAPKRVLQHHPWVPPRRNDASSTSSAAPMDNHRNLPASTAIPEAYRTSPGIAPDYVPPVARIPKSGANEFTKRQRSIAARNMGIGAFFLIVGSTITYSTYEAAVTSPGGGTYFIAWGAILFGAIRFIAALIRFCTV